MIKLYLLLLAASAPAFAWEAKPGEYVLKFKKGASFAASGAEILDLAPSLGIALVKIPAGRAAALVSSGVVEYAEPNFIYETFRQSGDSKFWEQWGLKNTGQSDPWGDPGVAGVDINATGAWEITTGSREVIIAITDTGMDTSHVDLKDNVWRNESESKGKAGVDDDGNGYVDDITGWDFASGDNDPTDDLHMHGTHVAGIAGASGDNAVGIAGVSWRSRLMPLKIIHGGEGELFAAVKAIEYAANMGAKVINASWGGDPYSEALRDAIRYAGDKGALFVAAAGNSSGDNDQKPVYPASYDLPNLISVAAITHKGALAGFSCYGKRSVQLAAPGDHILSAVVGDRWELWSGTSMAAPFVSGTAALLLSQSPEAGPAELKRRLLASADATWYLKNKVAAGRLNAKKALETQ